MAATATDAEKIKAKFAKVSVHAQGTGAEAETARRIRAKMLEDHPWLGESPRSSTGGGGGDLAAKLRAIGAAIAEQVSQRATDAAARAATRATARFEAAVDNAVDRIVDNAVDSLFPTATDPGDPPMSRKPPSSSRGAAASSRRAPARMSVAAIMEHVGFSGRILSVGDTEGDEPAADDPVAIVLWIDRLDMAEALSDKAESTEAVAKKLGKLLISALHETVDGQAPGDCDLWEWLGEEGEEEEDDGEE